VTRCLEKDPLFSKAYPLNELNLMQMTRKKKGHTLRYYLLEECGACKGEGAILAYSYLKNEIRNEFLKKKSHVEINSYHLTISDIYKERITKELEKFLSEVQANDKEIYLEFDSNLESLYTLSPLVFKSQIEEVESFRVNL
jgi:ribonuclease G